MSPAPALLLPALLAPAAPTPEALVEICGHRHGRPLPESRLDGVLPVHPEGLPPRSFHPRVGYFWGTRAQAELHGGYLTRVGFADPAALRAFGRACGDARLEALATLAEAGPLRGWAGEPSRPDGALWLFDVPAARPAGLAVALRYDGTMPLEVRWLGQGDAPAAGLDDLPLAEEDVGGAPPIYRLRVPRDWLRAGPPDEPRRVTSDERALLVMGLTPRPHALDDGQGALRAAREALRGKLPCLPPTLTEPARPEAVGAWLQVGRCLWRGEWATLTVAALGADRVPGQRAPTLLLLTRGPWEPVHAALMARLVHSVRATPRR